MMVTRAQAHNSTAAVVTSETADADQTLNHSRAEHSESMAQSVPQSMDGSDMRSLLEMVTQTTERLQATHQHLHEQVARLQQELAEANQKLRRSSALAALGEMAAGIAHEIRNPLGSIRLYAQMLTEDLADDPDKVDLCRKVTDGVMNIDAIVRDVLLFARDMRMNPQPSELEPLVQRARSDCESLLLGRNVTFDIDSRNDDVVNVDAVLLIQAISNLIRNAVEAMIEADVQGPRIVVTLDRCVSRDSGGKRKQYGRIAIQDSGPGVPDDVFDRMFNPFFTTREAGTGLGLAIVHRIVDGHAGFVNVSNATEGGARFELCLPLQNSPKQTAVIETKPSAAPTCADSAGQRRPGARALDAAVT